METLITLCAILNILALVVLGARIAVKKHFPGVADFLSDETKTKLDQMTFQITGEKK